ncbi:MAG: hypothetical protein LLG14_12760 [Nocardiaceae bacterium]|nr:hypothetical protein [Nocardiaceae bacterium]
MGDAVPGNSRAVVIGAGIGGLLAAGALSPHFDEVVVIERDKLPDEPVSRRYIPQSKHLHTILVRGKYSMEKIYPEWGQIMSSRGAVSGDIGLDIRSVIDGKYLRKQVEVGVQNFFASRELTEWALRQCARKLPNVTILQETSAHALVTNDTKDAVVGVTVDEHGTHRTIDADLVIDSSGRGAQGLAWLGAIGYERPAEKRIRVNLTYGTRHYKRAPWHFDGAVMLGCGATREINRGGVMHAQEDDTWIVTLSGYGNDVPAVDEEGFIAYARSFAAPDMADAISSMETVGEGHQFKVPHVVWRDYKGAKLPANYLPFGDAIAAFNPIYAQGMTVAAEEAVILADCLERGKDDLQRRFLDGADKFVGKIWNSSAARDLALTADPDDKKRGSVQEAVVRRISLAMATDGKVVSAFQKVANYIAEPPSLMKPSLIARVIWANRPGALKQATRGNARRNGADS